MTNFFVALGALIVTCASLDANNNIDDINNNNDNNNNKDNVCYIQHLECMKIIDINSINNKKQTKQTINKKYQDNKTKHKNMKKIKQNMQR